jgi:hypothetical protein
VVATNYADSQRRPDTLNETGPWFALVPNPGGEQAISLELNLEFSILNTGCGGWTVGYVQDGDALTFSNLPPAPDRCSAEAAKAHTWFVSQLADTRSFSPAEFWSTSDTPTLTFHGADGEALVAVAISSEQVPTG